MPALRQSISRDTRWLLIVVAVSLTALSMLARVRFGGAARIAGPIAPVLSQLASRSPFEEMSAAIDGLLPRLRAVVVPLALDATTAESGTATFAPAIRFRDGFAAALIADEAPTVSSIVAVDRATRLAVARVPSEGLTAPVIRDPGATAQSGFFAAVSVQSGAVVARPVFVPAFAAAATPRWPNPMWTLQGAAPVDAGSFLFTLDGALTGLVVDIGGEPALVPASVMMSEAERVLSSGARNVGYLDIEVQRLTPPLKAATGAPNGVVVSWTATPESASGSVIVGDVITEIDGNPIASTADWQARADRVVAEQPVALTVWRAGEPVAITVVARGDAPDGEVPLGLTLQTLPRTGARVERVVTRSAADQAGLRAGDILTRVGDVHMPTAAQALRAFRAAAAERPLLVAVTRGDTHFVIAMDKRW